MKTFVAGFYHDPPIWADKSPMDPSDPSKIPFDAFRDEVFHTTLNSAVEVNVTREGLFAFSFRGWPDGHIPPKVEGESPPFERIAGVLFKRRLVMNTFLAFLYTNLLKAGKEVPGPLVITPDVTIAFDEFIGEGMAFGNDRVTALALSSYESTYRSNLPPFMDGRLQSRSVTVGRSVLENTSFDASEFMASHGGRLILADLFLRTTLAYQEHNHSLSLITSWAIVENLLNMMWDEYQTANAHRDGKPFIAGSRKRRLQDGRTFTASVIAETLSLLGLLELELYSDLNEVRRRRNDWMHGLKEVDAASAGLAMAVTEQMFQRVLSTELLGSRSLRFRSIGW